jgi:predicted amidophosphoribosyltransferase
MRNTARPYCQHCNLFLHAHEVDTEVENVTSEFWGMRETTQFSYLVCGACRNDIEELHPCERCKAALPQKGYDNCAPCEAIIEQHENAVLANRLQLRETLRDIGRTGVM